jgi:hypothetical protein
MNNTITNDTTLELAPAEVSSEPFAKWAAWIRREHEYLIHDSRAVIEHSAGVGEILERIKEALPYGAWTPWTERNLPGMSDRTIRRYREIFRRKGEPLALEDPAAFLAGIYGKLELPPLEVGSEPAASTVSKTDVTSDLPSDGEKPSPPKRISKSRKVKTPPSTDAPSSTVPGREAGSVSLEGHLDLAAEALERAVGEWKRGSLAPLREAARGNERILGGLERMERDLDLLAKRLHDYARILHR